MAEESFYRNYLTKIVVQLRLRLCVILLSMLSHYTYADAWTVEGTVTVTPGNSLATYTLRITDWDFTSTIPNPLYGCNLTSYCAIALILGPGYEYPSTTLTRSRDVISAKTMGDLGRVMLSHGLWFGKTHTRTSQNSTTCSYPGYRINGGTWVRLPGGQCTTPTLPPTTCSFDAPLLEFTHTQDEGNVNGSKVSGTINVTCTQPTLVRIKSPYGVNSIILDRLSDFQSVLTVNDQPLSTGVLINASPSTTRVYITSTLKGNPPPGNYQGSTPIIIALP